VTPTALLFDLDGTLTDNYAGIAASIVHALARLDRPAPDAAVLRTCVGPPLRGTFAHLLGTTEAALIERAVAHYRERYAEVGWHENVAYEGAGEALAALHTRGARTFLCTSKPTVFATRIVRHFGFDAHLHGIYGADFDSALDDKAALLAHLLATERIDPGTATMIGDRANDIRAAHANGVRAVGALWGYGSRQELADAEALVATPAGLVTVLLGPTTALRR
jgi:phosphoglycolate phosphatase